MVYLVIHFVCKENWAKITICTGSWKVVKGRRLGRKMAGGLEIRELGFRHVSRHMGMKYEDIIFTW